MQYPQFFRRAAACCLAAGVSVVSAFAGSENPNLPNFYKVDDHVFRGAQPSDAGFKDLAKLGIKTVIDLREIGEHSQAAEEKNSQRSGYALREHPDEGDVHAGCEAGRKRFGDVH